MELQSNCIADITKAMCKAQSVMSPAKKTQTNPFFKSKYAGLEDVIEAVKDAFCDNGLSFFQGTLPGDNGSIIIVTTISHESGEWIRGYLPIKPTKNDPQSLGSAITYGKRYGLQALSGQPSEDDDGNTASKKPKKATKEQIQAIEDICTFKELSISDLDSIIIFYHNAKKATVQTIDNMSYDMIQNLIDKFDTVYNSWKNVVEK